MRRIPSVVLLIVPLLIGSFLACRDDRSSTPRDGATPFTGEQLDRIDAGVRAQRPPEAAPGDAPSDPRPLWVTNEIRDEGLRLVIHVRLPVAGDLDNLERNQARCMGVRERMREFLLPGQRVELYLVFDDSVHACRDDG